MDDEPREPALEAALRADPDDDATLLVYADWLAQRDHPRGALIGVERARRERPDDAALAAEDERLRALLGPPAIVDRLALEWRLGFVRAARVYAPNEDAAADQVRALLDHPSARFLRALEVTASRNVQAIVDRVRFAEPAPPLASLQLPIDRGTDVGGLGARYPGLRSLVLAGFLGDPQLAELGAPGLRRFALRSTVMRRSTLATLLGLPWPQLADLEIELDENASDGYQLAAECNIADLGPLLDGQGVPALRTLRLHSHAGFRSDEIPLLLRSPIIAQLEVLQLTGGGIDLDVLRAARPVLAHLRALRMYESNARGLVDSGLPVVVI